MRYLASLVILLVSAGWCGAAYIYEHKGLVEYRKTDKDAWERVPAGGRFTITAGMQMRTARASMAEIHMDDGSRVKVAPLSNFTLSAEDKEKSVFGLASGRMRSWVKKFSRRFEVRTPSAVCAVRGTDYTTGVDGEGNTTVEVSEGSVLVGDAAGRTALVREGETTRVEMGGGVQQPVVNPDPPSGDDASLSGARELARREIYTEISKDAVVAQAQAEMQSAEYQNRKTAVDAFGRRVRMEEYTIRPAGNQFKYVALNTRGERFDFGKILFTFNTALPADLSAVTANMITSAGPTAPSVWLTGMNSVMSNTTDKVTEDALNGAMSYNGSLTNPAYNLVFGTYKFYAAGPAEAGDNGGLGKELWAKTNYNVAKNTHGSITYLGGSAPTGGPQSFPSGSDTFHTYVKNTYSDGTWIAAEDFVLFDDGKKLSAGDFGGGLAGGETVDRMTDRLNFERVYISSLFGGRTIDLLYSAKLLKDIGMIRFE
ncbi:MAG: ogt3 [Elusimicrobia bacterium]|nr:MAG: ogt3 [Elusimicrobiota bacterium]KAF0156421.1 MAG: ogt3 [Elusimicrobiota bacterium]